MQLMAASDETSATVAVMDATSALLHECESASHLLRQTGAVDLANRLTMRCREVRAARRVQLQHNMRTLNELSGGKHESLVWLSKVLD